MKFRIYRQLNTMDCGPTCLKMIARHYGKHYDTDTISSAAGLGKEGASMLGISEAAEKMGFRTRGVKIDYHTLTREVRLPCILHWDQYHFVVLVSHSKRKFQKNGELLKIADPARGLVSFTKKELLDHWISTATVEGEPVGTALLLEPMPAFFSNDGEAERKLNWGLVLEYFRNSKWEISQVFLALMFTSLLQMIFPFLTQSIVDTGINTSNFGFIKLVLSAQLFLILSRSVVDFIRARLLLAISTRVNLSILSDFWIKITRLPLSYFESYHTGDTLQRIGDNRQIQNFLTGPALNTLFSLMNFVIFSVVLSIYNISIFLVFLVGSILYFIWISFFMSYRRKINYQTFHFSVNENDAVLQLVQGMQEIRLNNAQTRKRWEWENIQTRIFQLTFRSLSYNQIQQAGALLINQSKDIVITFMVAGLVIKGELTFGALLAVQYIIGQLSGPIEQFISFLQSAQDAKISVERLNQIHQLKDEEDPGMNYLKSLPEDKSIRFSSLYFTYPGAGNEPVLNNLNLHIPEGKVTAIVGSSGSGKTTLLKLLLKIYDNYQGDIRIGDTNFRYISPTFWRNQCGSVLQDGYVFNDSILQNIAISEEKADYNRVVECCKVANILSFIESLPNGFNTKLGSAGVGISQGQKQRLLIARAIYKNPAYLFFDEATNALDANNERSIVENLQAFFKGRTVIVVAHRLSTVKNADNIIVMHNGRIEEQGKHYQLTAMKGRYFELVKNQLELGQ